MKSLNPFSRRERISGNLIESTWGVIFAGYRRVEGRCKNYGWTLIPNTKWNYSRSEHVKINCQIAKIVWKFDMPTKAARWKYNLRNAEKLYDFSRNSKLFLRISFGTRMTRINSQSAASGLPDRREKGTLGIADGSWPSTAFFVISVLRAWFVVQPQAAVAVPATGAAGGGWAGENRRHTILSTLEHQFRWLAVGTNFNKIERNLLVARSVFSKADAYKVEILILRNYAIDFDRFT